MFRSLWFRLTGTVVFVVVVTMVVALVASLIIMQREFVEFVNMAAEALDSQPVETEIPPEEREIIIQDLSDLPLPDELNRLLTDLIRTETVPSISVSVPQSVQDEAVQFLETMRDTLLLAVGFSGALAIIASTWLFWGITRPLSKLRSATEAIASGDLAARAPVKRKDEVGRVAEAFNSMADRLERQESLRKRMVADVAHELRTPLSVMRGNLEAMIDELIPTSEEELDAVHQEVLRLSRLVEDLRILSLADAGELKLVIDEVNTSELVETAVRRLTPAAEVKGITLLGDIGDTPGIIMGDEGKLQQVLANLISNAIRFTPAGGKVTVESRTLKDKAQFLVRDEGPGVDPADLPYFFERFWKEDRARVRGQDLNRDGSGSGLGLSIVRQLVELHGGTVEASLPDGGGLQVVVTLPASSHPVADQGTDKDIVYS
jgi:signal transduction histidine kinase